MSINRVTITGNLTRDPELRAASSGTQILRLGVAVNDRRFNQQTQQWEDQPNYIDCVVFGKRAESLSRFLAKGTKVAIEGKLRWSSWQDRETGKNRSKVEVVVDDLEFMSSNRQQPGQYQPQQQDYQPQGGYPQFQQGNQQYEDTGFRASAPASAQPRSNPNPPEGDFNDSNIPF